MLDKIINIRGGVLMMWWSSTTTARNVPDWKVLKAAHAGPEKAGRMSYSSSLLN